MAKQKRQDEVFDLAGYIEIALKDMDKTMETYNGLVARGVLPEDAVKSIQTAIRQGLNDQVLASNLFHKQEELVDELKHIQELREEQEKREEVWRSFFRSDLIWRITGTFLCILCLLLGCYALYEHYNDQRWGYRAWVTAQYLGFENPGEFYDRVMTDFQTGNHKRCKRAVKKMENQWENEREMRLAVKAILDKLMEINSTVMFVDIGTKGDNQEFMVTFRFTEDKETCYRAAHFTTDKKVKMTRSSKIQCMKDIHDKKVDWKVIGEYN